MIDDTLEELTLRLEKIRGLHRGLDDEIAKMSAERPFDQLEIKRLKKRKLALKDQIMAMENALLPDIIA